MCGLSATRWVVEWLSTGGTWYQAVSLGKNGVFNSRRSAQRAMKHRVDMTGCASMAVKYRTRAVQS